ncbi:hypothetical protein [Flavobacterium croceum]|uniref:hypothetical protein n=1 Tax=Flavobacterium croceum TaxID=370975 RepID=UPI0024A7D2C9|nr:hypothetical protein [Flavobacterium croceum]
MNITYLIGAGASRDALPIVNEIPNRIEKVISLLESQDLQLSVTEKFDITNLELTKREVQINLINDLKWLLENSSNHASIDTFAKKLYIKNRDKDLNRLKSAFSIYLIIEQTINKADKRYDGFFASILKDNYYDFPENLKILNWNYDFQFEKTYSEYSDQKELRSNKNSLNIVSKYTRDRRDNNNFSIIKLNGTTNIIGDNGINEYHYFSDFENSLSITFLEKILRNYAALQLVTVNRLYSGLSFAWERFYNDNNDIIKIAQSKTFETEVLVVIGYSFPYFNREVDRAIIGNMKNLSKVYFQSPDAETIKERFLSIRDDIPEKSLLTRKDVGQFLLPNEL